MKTLNYGCQANVATVLPFDAPAVSFYMAREHPANSKYLTRYAKRLRAKPTMPERIVWSRIRRHALGTHFVRQSPIGTSIVDFLAPDLRLVLEVDEESHREGGEQDAKRQAAIEALDYFVVRITNDDVPLRPAETFVWFREIVTWRAREVGATLAPRVRKTRS